MGTRFIITTGKIVRHRYILCLLNAEKYACACAMQLQDSVILHWPILCYVIFINKAKRPWIPCTR